MVHETHNPLTDKICLECNREFTGIIANCPHDNSLLFTKVQDPFIGTTLGDYQIESVLGQGGMGVVYRARHNLMERTVAIKMLQASLISDSMSVKRFQQESKAASRINHPNVITVYDFGISPTGQPYIVMDYLEGIALSDVIKKEGQVSVERAIKIVTQACDALQHAHKGGVVHRDLKPTNIVLIRYDDEDDFVKVVDFGVAKLMGTGADGQRLTQAGEVCGSPVYMSPEQCKGEELDPRSDIYSMGIVVYETLTGKLPILGRTMVETMSKHISEMPPSFADARPDLYIPERLETVVFKALAKDPNDRHQTMEELRQDLDLSIPRAGRSQILRTLPEPTISAETILETIKKGPAAIIAVVAAVLLVVGVGTTAIFMNAIKKAPPPVQTTMPAPLPLPTVTTPVPTTTPTTTIAPTQKGTTPATAVQPAPGANDTQQPAPVKVPVTASAITDKPKHIAPKPRRSVAAITKPRPSVSTRPANTDSRWNDIKGLRSY